jgi:proline racemase
MGVPLNVKGIGQITVDTAFGGDSFVVVDAAALGFDLVASEAKALADLGVAITNAANAQLTFHHPSNPDWKHFSFCLFAGPITRDGNHLTTSAAVAIQPGKIDRSPTGTAASARMALLHARGDMQVGETFTARSIINSEFHGRIAQTTKLGDTPAIIPEITGRAWITGTHQHMLDPDDPWPEGYRLSDTWPDLKDRAD